MTKKRINSKKKGNRVELEFSKVLSDRFNKTFKRVPMSGAWGTTNRDTDIREDAKEVLSGDLICPSNFRFSVECKSRADFNFWDILNEDTKHLEIDDWIWQAEQDASISNKEPLILIKINNRKPFVLFPKKLHEGKILYVNYTIMRFDYFLQLEDEFFFEEV
ncbi:MAG TPA: hypothetical protein VMZ91_02000 [Candidatus Paceibacterota bacterium]|nr:hypothetical protein [Candidatus Paceibacterota bacterium]